jgi:uridine kinase
MAAGLKVSHQFTDFLTRFLAVSAMTPQVKADLVTMIIGICGGTGSGKTTVARRILENVDRDYVAFLQHDSYYHHLGDMPFEMRHNTNFDHPDALDNDLFASHINALRAGESIEMPVYDFATHTRRPETELIEPKPILMLEGILIFYRC